MGELKRDASAGRDALAQILGPGRILVIESDTEARDILVQFFAVQGYRVDQAADGEEGLYLAHEAETPYDVVLLDDHLPDATGLEMLPALRAATPESLLVLMSRSDASQRFYEAMACGAYEFVQKPPWLQEALRVVTRGVRERRNGFVAEAVGHPEHHASEDPRSRSRRAQTSQAPPHLSPVYPSAGPGLAETTGPTGG